MMILSGSCPGLIYSQNYHTTSNRALNAYVAGKRDYEYLYFNTAEKSLKEALSIDKKFWEPAQLLGEMFAKQRRFSESAEYYRRAVSIDSLFDKSIFYRLAEAEFNSGDYARALVHYNVFLDLKLGPEQANVTARNNMANCRFALEAMKSPVPFNLVGLGDSVNTSNDEYWPSLTADGQVLMFTRQVRNNRPNTANQEDFYFSRYHTWGWGKAVNAGPPLNTAQNEGAQSISSDGSYMYFTACGRPGGAGRCDIYYSVFDGSNWSAGFNPGPPLNTNYWEAQPSLTTNGKIIFFVSNRPGGFGGMDLWMCLRKNDGRVTLARNLGPVINTKGDEMSPFIHFDNRTLYFSTNGRPGMGGQDIYFSRMNDDSTWTEPRNLGYPINTYNDEMGLVIDANGQNAYFSSKRDEKMGKDIFSFSLYEAARPDPVSYFRGIVSDSETGKFLSADYELINLKTGEIIASGRSDARGSMLVCLPTGLNYGLTVNKQGYLFYSDNFMLEGIHSVTSPFNKDVMLNPLEVGKTLQLSNVFFEVDSWQLKRESLTELDRLYRLMAENKTLVVEIAGFTDSTGTDAHNVTLSERRAISVADYLRSRGISADRLSSRGFGSANPLGTNITTEGRKLNRRTEVKIVSLTN
ncbi:MAG: OmpA family protein [Bacteroidales bacterium]